MLMLAGWPQTNDAAALMRLELPRDALIRAVC